MAVRATVACLAAVVALGPLALARSAESLCAGVTPAGDLWARIDAPEFGSGPGAIATYEVHPSSPSIIFVTNGKSVMRTVDRGCTWKEVFAVSLLPSLEVPVSAANAEIADITIPDHSAGSSRVYLAVEERVGPVARPHVIVNQGTGSGRWTASDNGLPPATGRVLGLYVAPSSPNFLYLHLSRPTGNDELYASTNAASSWERRSPTTGYEGVAHGLMVDPISAYDVWFWGGSGLFRSSDGGRDRSLVDEVAPPVPFADVFHAPGRPARIMAYEAETFTFSVSRDGGKDWTRFRGPQGAGISMARGRGPSDIVMSVPSSAYRFNPPRFWLDVAPRGRPTLLELSADRTADPAVYGRTPGALYTFTGLEETSSLDPFDVDPAVAQGDAVSRLLPEKVTVRLDPRAAKTVPYRLTLPPRPTPLDVFFLVDTSMSMEPTIAGLRAGMQRIVDDLARSGLDVQFGVGEFKDYPIPGYGDPQAGDFPYRLNRKIGPADDELAAALDRLESSGGGIRDPNESQLTALFQAATGRGEPGFVAPGQDAGFRAGSLPVIVHITDAAFHDDPAHPAPPFDQVADELDSRDILQVGLAVFGRNGMDGLGDLLDMAESTNATAPAEGVDCDGNGTRDVAPGDPLVCEITDESSGGGLELAPAIVATLKAVTDEAQVGLVAAGAEGVVTSIDPPVRAGIDLKDAQEVAFDVRFSCPASLAGRRRTIDLAARVRGDDVAHARALVVCRDLSADDKARREPPALFFVPPAAGVLATLLPVPPPPPPPLAEQGPASQSSAQAQAAMAEQEQEELQVAVARQRTTFSSERQQYAMSAFERRSRPSPAPLYAAASVLAAAFAYVAIAGRSAAARARRR